MPRRPTEQQLLDDLLDRYGADIAKAFQAAIDDLRTGVDLQAAITAIEAGDLNGAIAALHLDAATMNPVLDAIAAAYRDGGTTAASFIPAVRTAAGLRVVIRFNVRNPAAERWLKDHSSTLVTRILDDQRQAVRQALTAGLEKGQNPRNTALDIVGRIDRASGKREGGILGLTAQQEGFARSARDELSSGDPAQMRNYFTRVRRDKRFDRTVQKAINEESAVDATTLARIEATYRNRLLQLRGEVIGKRETFAALQAAKDQAYSQAIATGAISPGDVTKTWRHFPSRNPREQHIVMNGATVKFNERFRLPDGTMMRFPHDPEAPADQVVGCYCQADYRIDFLAGVG